MNCSLIDSHKRLSQKQTPSCQSHKRLARYCTQPEVKFDTSICLKSGDEKLTRIFFSTFIPEHEDFVKQTKKFCYMHFKTHLSSNVTSFTASTATSFSLSRVIATSLSYNRSNKHLISLQLHFTYTCKEIQTAYQESNKIWNSIVPCIFQSKTQDWTKTHQLHKGLSKPG